MNHEWKKALWAGGAIALLSIAGCNRAESPAEVARDVTSAQQDRAEEVADARQDVNQESRDVAIARAEGDHKITIEQCEALAGDAQKACKDQADAALASAKANIDAMAAHTP